MERKITDNLDGFLEVFPPYISQALKKEDYTSLLEVIMDFGRYAEARFNDKTVRLSDHEVSLEDIHYVTFRLSDFGDDNRAGIERTLHRISAIRNRKGDIIGLSCRVGRSVMGTIKIIEDIVQSNKSILLLGRPGIGKTTMLREIARVLSDEMNKRVVIVDTSNEIAGDGDIPHPAIGNARRMQVAKVAAQHAVMIEAVENHMPEVIIIDEIGTELEALAARTIAERGVQLIGTAHGNTLENLLVNPTLSDLIGGVGAVTLGDDEAKRRGTQKTILERKSPPTFNVVIDIIDRSTVAIHHDTAAAVDSQLRNGATETEMRHIDENDQITASRYTPPKPVIKKSILSAKKSVSLNDFGSAEDVKERAVVSNHTPTPRIFLYGLSRMRFEQEASDLGIFINWTDDLKSADLFVTSKTFFRTKPQRVHDAEDANLPIYVLKNHTPVQFRQFLSSFAQSRHSERGIHHKENDMVKKAAREIEVAISKVHDGQQAVELSPQSAYIRRLQHLIAEQNNMQSISKGRGESRRVFISSAPLQTDDHDKIDYAYLEEQRELTEEQAAEEQAEAIHLAQEEKNLRELKNFNFDRNE